MTSDGGWDGLPKVMSEGGGGGIGSSSTVL